MLYLASQKKDKMKKILTSALLISLLTISCKKEETAEPIANDNVPITSEASSEQKNNVVTPIAAPSMTNQPTTTMNGLNPAHGQPGHRCEIAVGAPLNSTPSASSNNLPNTTQPSVVPANATSPMSNTTASGMNPAHGQPGHSCSIPVGAPLSQLK